MTPKCNITLSGRYKIQTIGPGGEIRQELDWFDNIITDLGLDLYSGRVAGKVSAAISIACLNKICVGTSNTAPAISDVALGSWVADHSVIESQADTINTPSRYFSLVKTVDFNAGVATGNLSEVGAGYDKLSLFSRALIKDGNGDPTTITVLADEVLRVSYELRINIPTVSWNFTVDGYDFVLKAGGADGGEGFSKPGDRTAESTNWAYFYSGAIGLTIDDFPSGTQEVVGVTDSGAYTLGSYTYDITMSASLIQANISITAFSLSFGAMAWQGSISPAIVKDNTKTVDLGLRITWAREGELPP